MEKVRQFIKRQKDIILAFFAPVGVLFVAFLILGVYPFGSKNIINSDLYAQFLPIMIEMKRALSGGSLLYSFSGGLGSNFFVLNTYQNASPLTWLFLLIFREDQMVLCATLLFIVKTGLASASMYYYLKSRNGDGNSFPMIVLSALYSLCGYVTAFYCNLMWLECVILLPLIILGMKRAVEKQGNKLYIVSLALMLFTSYYIGLMVYLFLFVYFFIYFFSEREKGFWKAFVKIRLLSLFAVMLSMVVLLPTYYALTKTGNYETMGGGSSSLFHFSITVHLAQLLPGSYVTILNGPPNIYSGLITILLCLMYLLNRGVDRRRKVLKTVFVLFVFFCTNFIPLDTAWQLNHPPNGFPSRYSFIFTFLAIEMACDSLAKKDFLGTKGTMFAIACLAAIYITVLAGGAGNGIDLKFLLGIGMALTLLYAFLFLVIFKRNNRTGTVLLGAVILLELLVSTTYSFGAGGVVESNRLLYRNEEVQELLEKAEADSPNSRAEVFGTDNLNAPYLYGYRGVSIFASSVSGDTFRVLNTLWKDTRGNGRSFTYDKSNPVSDSLADIVFYISIDKELSLPWAEEIARTENCYLYKSRYETSVGFMVPEEMKNLDFDKPRWEVLNRYIEIASGVEGAVNQDGIDMNKWEEAFPVIYDELLKTDEMKGNKVSGNIDVREGGVLFTSIPYDDGWTVKVDGEKVEDYSSIRYFVSFPLTKGEHRIEMVYTPPKLILGSIISGISLLVFLCVIIIRYGGKINEEKDR